MEYPIDKKSESIVHKHPLIDREKENPDGDSAIYFDVNAMESQTVILDKDKQLLWSDQETTLQDGCNKHYLKNEQQHFSTTEGNKKLNNNGVIFAYENRGINSQNIELKDNEYFNPQWLIEAQNENEITTLNDDLCFDNDSCFVDLICLFNVDLYTFNDSINDIPQYIEYLNNPEPNHTTNNIYVKMTKLYYKNIFLKKCKYFDIIPNSLKIKNKNPYKINNINNIFKNTEIKILNTSIRNNYKLINNLNNKLKNNNINIDILHNKYKPLKNKLIDKYKNKLNYLINKNIKNQLNIDINNKFNDVVNISDFKLNTAQLQILNKGTKYIPNLPYNNIEIKKNLEHLIDNIKFRNIMNEDNIQLFSGAIYKCFIDFDNKLRNKNRNNKENKQINKLIKLKKEIYYSKSDKGNKFIVMNHNDYIKKTNELLNNKKHFKLVKYTKIKTREKKINNFIHTMIDENSINKNEYTNLLASNSDDGYMYCLPKIHKANNPLRPIISGCSTPSYKLAKYLNSILYKYIKELDTILNNSKNLIDITNKLPISNNFKMASYDIVSLFTNVPIMDSIAAFMEIYNNSKYNRINISNTTLAQGLLLCCDDNYFNFNNKSFKQIEGLSMGGPLSSLLANAFIYSIEKTHIFRQLDNTTIWKRYIDDVFVTYNNNSIDNYFENLLIYLNNIHNTVKFTLETQNNNNLNFLDIKIEIDDNKLNLSIFTKPTAKTFCTHFNSDYHLKQKIAFITNNLHRIYNTCNNDNIINAQKQQFKHQLINSAYPTNIINKSFINFDLNKKDNRNKNKYDHNKTNLILKIPYKSHHTDKLKYNINKVLKKFNIKDKIKIYDTPRNNLEKLLITKNYGSREIEKTKSCVYQYTCNCSGIYIGETSLSVRERFTSHFNPSLNSAIREHSDICSSSDAKYDKKCIKILHHERNKNLRKISEALFIRQVKPNINRDNGRHLNIFND